MRKTDKNIRYSYKRYKKENKNAVGIKDFVEICNNYHKFLMEKVFQTYEVTLPCKLGTFQIVGRKTKIRFLENGQPNLAPDWKKTKELWDKNPKAREERKRIFHTNDHTGGVRYKLHWSKKRVLVKNKSLFSFRLKRHNKRKIYNLISNKNKSLYVNQTL